LTPSESILWEKILHFELDDPDSEFAFSDRLARENGWKLGYALGCMDEYKRFMFLMMLTEHPLTPSDQVDQVWHLHLVYTRSYWEEFCDRTLGKKIHHGPTKGGETEKDTYKNQYEATKVFYKKVFGHEPPAAYWPESSIRFSEINFVRVNRQRNWIIPKSIRK
jgi:hypothetical protein